MNKERAFYSRNYLKKKIKWLPERYQTLFKKTHSHTFKKDLEGWSFFAVNAIPDLNKDINQVIDGIPADRLSYALSQLERELILVEKAKALSL